MQLFPQSYLTKFLSKVLKMQATKHWWVNSGADCWLFSFTLRPPVASVLRIPRTREMPTTPSPYTEAVFTDASLGVAAISRLASSRSEKRRLQRRKRGCALMRGSVIVNMAAARNVSILLCCLLGVFVPYTSTLSNFKQWVYSSCICKDAYIISDVLNHPISRES